MKTKYVVVTFASGEHAVPAEGNFGACQGHVVYERDPVGNYKMVLCDLGPGQGKADLSRPTVEELFNVIRPADINFL